MCLDLIVVTRDRGGEGEKRNVEKFENYNFLKLARRPPPLNPGRKPEGVKKFMEMGSFFSTRVYCLDILKETVGRGSYSSVERINNVMGRDTPGH